MRQILVCGGAGYIGSHMVKLLAERGYDVTVLDNLSTGHREAVLSGRLIEGDLLDKSCLSRIFEQKKFDAVMHFSALSLVGESVRNPYLYYENNVVGALNLISAMKRAGADHLIFSSSASVYGEPEESPVTESQPVKPVNPYGASKAMVERMLADSASGYGLRSVSLRYFNAAGADPSTQIGESHHPETHLIPNLLQAALTGSAANVFGSDYDTRDGTCIRDYVHVNDLAQAHLLAMEYIESQPGAHSFNLGSDTGYSVLETAEAVKRVTGKAVKLVSAARRSGDPATLVASSRMAHEILRWKPAFSDLDAIVETAWRWQCKKRY